MDKLTVTWINVSGIHDLKMIESLGTHFALHPLLLEDIVNSGQRSKLDNYKDNLFIVLRLLHSLPEKKEIEDEQISLILGQNYVLSFVESQSEIFKSVEESLKNNSSRIKTRGADYLCYALVDCIVDHYFVILEHLDEQIEQLESSLIDHPTPQKLHEIQKTKREISLLRKSVWPIREVISQFLRLDTPLIKESTKLYMQDAYDHTIQIIDTIESFRDISSGLLDLYLSNLNFRMNESDESLDHRRDHLCAPDLYCQPLRDELRAYPRVALEVELSRLLTCDADDLHRAIILFPSKKMALVCV